MGAEIALQDGDLQGAAAQLQLALVYDTDSVYLTLKLASVHLRLGALAKAIKLADRAIALDPRSAEAFLLKARAELARNAHALAEGMLKRALALDPTSVDAAIELAHVLARAGKVAEALAVLAATAERVPESPDPLAEIAQLEAGRGRLEAAAQALERALRRDPRSAQLAGALSGIYEREGRYAEAAVVWRDLLELVLDDPDALLEAARAELWNERDEAADRDVELVQELMRGFDADQKIGLLYLSEGRTEKALHFLEAALRARPGDPSTRFAYATALAEADRDAAALAELQRIAPDSERYVDARLEIGRILATEGKLDRAIAALRAAVWQAPRSVPLISGLADLLERAGHRDEARRTLQEVRSAIAASDPDGAIELDERDALILAHAGERARALKILRAGAEQPGREEALYRLASLEERLGELDAALETAQRLLREAPDSARALNLVGYMWAERGVRLEEAQRLLRRAMSLEPRSGAIIDSLAWGCFRLGQLADAERFARRALRLSPHDPEIEEHLGDILLAGKRPDEARASYIQARDDFRRAVTARDPDAPRAVSRVEDKISRSVAPHNAPARDRGAEVK